MKNESPCCVSEFEKGSGVGIEKIFVYKFVNRNILLSSFKLFDNIMLVVIAKISFPGFLLTIKMNPDP